MAEEKGRQVLIHAGFHRTATKTIQNALATHRGQLAPHLEVKLKADLSALSDAAIAYGEHPSEANLAALSDAAKAAFAGIDTCDLRPLLISCEDLCGAFPHRKGRIGYLQAAPILKAVIAALPEPCQPTVFLMTRETTEWMKSCHAHSLRHARGRLTLADYVAGHAGPSLHEVADRIKGALPVPIITARLEDTATRAEGPLAPLLDLLGVPPGLRAPLFDPPHLNKALPQQLLGQFLSLNLTIDDNMARKRAKRAALAAWQENLND